MIDDNIKDAIRTQYKTYAQNDENFRPRLSQRQMIGTIASSFDGLYMGDDRPEGYETPVTVVHGPTGVGKTTGYLLGTLQVALATKKSLVISTATVALQNQLFDKDLPALKEKIGVDFTYKLAKGRRRYACVQRLDKKVMPGSAALLESQGLTDPYSDSNNELFNQLHGAFKDGSWDGDIDSWPETIHPSAWDKISTDAGGCMNRNCSRYRDCPFFKARNELAEANVVVANHDLVLSVLSSESPVLPEPERMILVADEAHHLPDKALSHSGSQHLINSATDWLRDSIKVVNATMVQLPPTTREENKDKFEVSDLSAKLTQFYDDFQAAIEHAPELQPRQDKRRPDPVWRFKHGVVPDPLLLIANNLAKLSSAFYTKLSTLQDLVREQVQDERISGSIAEQILPELGTYVARAEIMLETWRLFTQKDDRAEPPIARWIELRSKSSVPDFLIAASPIRADKILNRLIWSKVAGAVLTSATLTAGGSFDRFSDNAGLRYQNNVGYLKLASPFDYQTNATLQIPPMRSIPKDAEAHTAEITQWLNHNLDPTVGSLVLFTSHKQMQKVYEDLEPVLQEAVLLQGATSKQAIINKHKERINAGDGSIIFGTNSFSEGVDLAGNLLTQLVISKLPFTVPDSPIYDATAEWMESVGRNPFLEMAVPDASIKLVQSVGRLIRTESDRGTVTILDTRLVSKRYGQTMIEDLPPMRRHFA